MLHSASKASLRGGLGNIPCCCVSGKSSPITQCPNTGMVPDLQWYLSDLFGHAEDPSGIYPEASTFDSLAQSLRSSEFSLPPVLRVFAPWAGLLSSGVAPYP